MPTFQYRAKSGGGQMVIGRLQAESRLAALDQLSEQGYFPLAIEERVNDLKKSRSLLFHSVSARDLGLFTRQLAELLESEVPLLKALILVQGQTRNTSLATVLGEVINEVREGTHFSEALKSWPRVFSHLYVSLIYAGEMGGALSVALSRLADFIEQEEDFKSRVWAALAYPLLVAFVGLGTVIFLLCFAVPKLSVMFTEMGQQMPLATRVLSDVSAWLVSYGAWLMVLIPVACLLCFSSYARRSVQKKLSSLLIKIPIWGPVIRKSLVARFARTLATLLSSGVPIVEALRVVAHVLGNAVLTERVLNAAHEVEQGESLSASLLKVPDFPAFFCHMVAVGEEINGLEKSLNKVAASYERETDRAMKLATSFLEPVMILVIGSLVGIIVIAMLLPIFQISAFIK